MIPNSDTDDPNVHLSSASATVDMYNVYRMMYIVSLYLGCYPHGMIPTETIVQWVKLIIIIDIN